MRDRGFSRKPKAVSKLEERAQNLASKAAKAELNALFSNSKISKEKAEKIKAIQALRGKPDYYPKLSEFYRDYGVPLEWDLQMLFLDHRDKKIVIDVLRQLAKTAPTAEMAKQDLLGTKLNVMEVSCFDPELAAEIRALKKALLRS